MKLDITRGRIIFSGGPPDKATLDIVATRKVQQVATPGKLGSREELLVGVNVGGTITSPAVKLYSVPAMADPQVLSYIVFGKPLSTGAGQSALLSQAASALLAAGPSSGIQQRMKSELGIETIDIAPGNEARTSHVRLSLWESICRPSSISVLAIPSSPVRTCSPRATDCQSTGKWRANPGRRLGLICSTASSSTDTDLPSSVYLRCRCVALLDVLQYACVGSSLPPRSPS